MLFQLVEGDRFMKNKFCEFCGNEVAIDAVICPKCGKQIEKLKSEENSSNPQVVINNINAVNGGSRKKCDKWTALLLCIFFGFLGGHKFYEEKNGVGILYILTFGLFGIGIIIDLISILFKPNPYYV